MVVEVDVDGGSVFAVEGLQLGTVTSLVAAILAGAVEDSNTGSLLLERQGRDCNPKRGDCTVVDVDVDCGFSRSVSVEGLQLGT